MKIRIPILARLLKSRLFCYALALIVSFTMVTACHHSKSIAAERSAKYLKIHQLLKQQAKEGNIDLLFIGDSITEYWLGDGKKVWDQQFGSWKPGNFGIAGDTTSGVLWRIADGELDGLKPKVIVLLIGTNDLSLGETMETIAENNKKIVHTLKQKFPGARIVVLGLLPRGPAENPVRQAIIQTNKLLASLDNGNDVRFLDIGKNFVDKNGTISDQVMPDALHLSSSGYKIFADAIKPLVSDLMK